MPIEIEVTGGVSVDDHDAFMEKHVPNIEYEIREFQVFHWKLQGWKKLERSLTSSEFECGGYKWRILLKVGNFDTPSSDFVSVHLDCTGPKNAEGGWHACAQFALVISNPHDPTTYKVSCTDHRFIAEVRDWGFTGFSNLRNLSGSRSGRDRPIIEEDSAVVSVYVRVLDNQTGALWHNHNSREKTGHIGLRGQGAGCMNAVLQSLFFINSFGKAVYQTQMEGQSPNESDPRELQQLFYDLQTSDKPVSTTELLLSLGWGTSDFLPARRNVQEVTKVFRDNLESKLKGTRGEDAIPKLFSGKTKTSVKCTNINYEETMVDEFYDIELKVEGVKTLHDSLRHCVAAKTLGGGKKYQAGSFGPQDGACKSVAFRSFPPVLHLRLGRYKHDPGYSLEPTKVNDRFEFPLEIDLGEFLDGGCRNSKLWNYRLHSVIVHAGDRDSGGFYVFVNPGQRDRWFKFDDERVTPVTALQVLEGSYGGEPPNDISPQTQKDQIGATTGSASAHMLVYIREAAIGEVLAPFAEKDVPLYLTPRKQQKGLDSLVTVKVITDETFSRHQGFDLTVVNEGDSPLSNLPTIYVPKQEAYSQFKRRIARHFDCPESHFRLEGMSERENKTLRVGRCVPDDDHSSTAESIRNDLRARQGILYLYLDKLPNPSPVGYQSRSPGVLPSLRRHTKGAKSDDARTVGIFLKHFNITRQSLFGVGKVHLLAKSKVKDLVPIINERMGWPPGKALKLYEEIKPGRIEYMNPNHTLTQGEIVGGDIVCFQDDISDHEIRDLETWGLCSNARQFYKRLQG